MAMTRHATVRMLYATCAGKARMGRPVRSAVRTCKSSGRGACLEPTCGSPAVGGVGRICGWQLGRGMKATVLVLMVMVGAIPSHAWEDQARDLCEPMGVPLRLVRAIVAVESGGNPYALHVRIGDVGQAYYPTSYGVAQFVLDSLLSFTPHIDVGLMQINVHVWADELSLTPYELLLPEANLWAGCTILSRYLAGPGPLWQRIGRYHSRTPARNEAYAWRVLRRALNGD